MSGLVAAAALTVAVLLLVPSWPRAPGRWLRLPTWFVSGVLLAAGLVVGGLLAVVVLLAVLGGLRLVRLRRQRLAAAALSEEVLESCEHVASELAVGQPPGAVLQRCAADWPMWAPVAEAFRIGADVPSALREASRRGEGARDLRVVAAAWEVAHRTGRGLAEAVDRVAADLRAAHATQRVVDGELASARATARLVAGLPVLALLMGSGAGGDPFAFLVGHPVGIACLGAGLAFGLAGMAWIEAIARGVAQSR